MKHIPREAPAKKDTCVINTWLVQVRIEDEALQTNMTFTKETEKCPQCFTDKPPNPLAKYCHQCSFYLPPRMWLVVCCMLHLLCTLLLQWCEVYDTIQL